MATGISRKPKTADSSESNQKKHRGRRGHPSLRSGQAESTEKAGPAFHSEIHWFSRQTPEYVFLRRNWPAPARPTNRFFSTTTFPRDNVTFGAPCVRMPSNIE
jgi:hypothetical protein